MTQEEHDDVNIGLQTVFTMLIIFSGINSLVNVYFHENFFRIIIDVIQIMTSFDQCNCQQIFLPINEMIK